MPLKRTNVIVQGVVYTPPDPGDHVPDMGAHPELPIYYPIPIPPDLGIWGPTDPRPTPPIFIPVPPLGIWGPTDPRPTPPIYLPVLPDVPGLPPLGIWGGNDPYPTPPIYLPIEPPEPGEPPELPDLPPWNGLDDAIKQKLVDFLLGNLPPYEGPPSVQPV